MKRVGVVSTADAARSSSRQVLPTTTTRPVSAHLEHLPEGLPKARQGPEEQRRVADPVQVAASQRRLGGERARRHRVGNQPQHICHALACLQP
jgi:hypothetical protein